MTAQLPPAETAPPVGLGGPTSRWSVVAASAVGAAHLATGVACQDAYRFEVVQPDVLVAVVADGAGSAPRSADGSAAAVGAAALSLASSLRRETPRGILEWGSLFEAAYAAAQDAVAQFAAAEGRPVREFATTLLSAIAMPTVLATAQIGDGFAVAATRTGDLFIAAAPQRGEYANETRFLTHANLAADLVVQVSESPVDGLVLSTDGMLKLALDLAENRPVPGFFTPLFAFTRASISEDDTDTPSSDLAAHLASPRVCARTDDDKTLVVAVYADTARGLGLTDRG